MKEYKTEEEVSQRIKELGELRAREGGRNDSRINQELSEMVKLLVKIRTEGGKK